MAKQTFDVFELTDEEVVRTFKADPADGGLRLDQFLLRRMHWMSRSRIQQVKAVKLEDGGGEERLLKKSSRIGAGDTIRIRFPQRRKDLDAAMLDPPLRALDVLFEDDSILVIDKPAGVPVHPSGRILHRTVITALHYLYRNPGDPRGDVVPSLAHRLDAETSGVLAAAKTPEALRNLSVQFRRRTVKKEYLAVVYGLVADEQGEIDLPLGPDGGSAVPYKQRVAAEGGRRAVTRFQVLERRRNLTFLRLLPLTGRQHQLRVHLAAIGHPIVGDKIYGPDEAFYFKARRGPPNPEDLERLLLPRQALHASALELDHPVRGGRMRFEAPRPAEFDSLAGGAGRF